jgi:hypothetical protein
MVDTDALLLVHAVGRPVLRDRTADQSENDVSAGVVLAG